MKVVVLVGDGMGDYPVQMQSCLIYIFSILLLLVSMCSSIESAFSETAEFRANTYVLKAENIRLGELLGLVRTLRPLQSPRRKRPLSKSLKNQR